MDFDPQCTGFFGPRQTRPNAPYLQKLQSLTYPRVVRHNRRLMSSLQPIDLMLSPTRCAAAVANTHRVSLTLHPETFHTHSLPTVRQILS